MNASLITAVASACLLAAVWMGMFLRQFLPAHHLSSDSKETVRMAMGLAATMSALLLGLLVNSAKNTYDTTRVQVMQKASKFALLNRVLEIYGPDAAEVRGRLHRLIEESVRQMWPDSAHADVPQNPNQTGNAFYLDILRLAAHDDVERSIKAEAIDLIVDIAQLHSLMDAESTPSISKPMLIIVVLWLVLIFFGFTLISPPNGTANFALIASTFCVASAIFLILELDRPFDGILRISSDPMLDVLRELGGKVP